MQTYESELRLLLVTLIFIAVPASVSAAEWSETFTPESLDAQFGDERLRIAVAGAGGDEEVRSAEDQLLEALRSGDTASTVVAASESVGDLSSLDDPTIVDRVAHLPVDRIAIVRVYPAGEGEPPSAVVTVYDPEGEPTTSFDATRGRPLGGAPSSAERSEERDAAEGESNGDSATESSDETPDSGAEPPESDESGEFQEARQKYERRRIWLESGSDASGVGDASSVEELAIFRGEQKVKLEGADFYTALDRPDLARKYRTNNTVTAILNTAGATMGLGGAINVMLPLMGLCEHACSPGIGAVFLGAGVASGLAGHHLVPEHPVSPVEARSLVREHNEKLKQQFGVSGSQSPVSSSDDGSGPTYRFGVGVTGRGVQTSLRIGF